MDLKGINLQISSQVDWKAYFDDPQSAEIDFEVVSDVI